MSEAKEPKMKRPVPAPPAAPEPAAVAEPAAAPAAVVSSEAAAIPAAVVPAAAAAEAAAAPAAVVPAAAAAAPLPLRAPRQTTSAAEGLLGSYRSAFAAVGEAQRAVANGINALTLEMTGLAQRHLTAAGDSAVALLGARNLADAVEIQLGFARRSFEGTVAASTRMREIGARLASDAARPIVAPLTGMPRRD